jgi:hypothetical protein
MWIADPVNGKKSVSLTMLIVVGLAALVANGLVVLGKASAAAGLNELFYSCMALYYGRRNLNIGGKVFSANKAEEIKGKISNE